MAKKTVDVKVYALHRLNNSVNGNPRYRMHTSEGELITSSDRAYCYGILNDWTDEEKTNGKSARIQLTRAGRVDQLEWV
jgi:hypothetical protein